MDFKFDLQRFATTNAFWPFTEGQEYQLAWETHEVDSSGNPNYKLHQGMVEVTAKLDSTTNKYTITGNIAEQTAKTTFKAPTSGVKYYANVYTVARDDGNGNTYNALVVSGIYSVSATGTTAITSIDTDKSELKVKASSATPTVFMHGGVASDDTTGITITQADGTSGSVDLANVGIKCTLTNLTDGSSVYLAAGDTAATASLKAGESVTVVPYDGSTYDATSAATYTSAGGVLNFVGEATTTSGVAEAALLSGSVQLIAESANDPAKATLAGTTRAYADNITVSSTDLDGVVVKVTNGAVSSITGLKNGAVTVTTPTGIEVYTDMTNEGLMFQKDVYAVGATVGTSTPLSTTYLNLTKAGGEVYKASYKAQDFTNVIGTWGTSKGGLFYYMGMNATAAGTTSTDTAAPVTSAGPTTPGDYTVVGGTFSGKAGGYYLKVNTTTNSNTTPATVTISGVEMYRSNAEGKLVKVSTPAYTGTIGGTTGLDASNAIVKYTKKASDKYNVNIINADIRSVFTNLGSDDSVTSNSPTNLTLSSGTYTVYNEGAVTGKITVKGNVTVSATATGGFTDVTGLNKGESVTIMTYTDDGVKTREFTASADNKFNCTITDADGVKAVYKNVVNNDLFNTDLVDVAASTFKDAEGNAITADASIVTTFDWTLDKSGTGYFKITNNAATVAATVTTVAKNTDYVKAVIDATNGITLTRVHFDEDLNESTNTAALTKLTINAPANQNITLAALPDADAIEIKNLAAGSEVPAIAGTKDSVSTAVLANDTMVTIGTDVYVGAGSKITVKKTGLTSGTVWAPPTGAELTVGDYAIATTATINQGDKYSEKSVTVKTANGKTFSIGAMDDGDGFTVAEGANTAVTYTKYGSYLYSATAGNPKMLKVGTEFSSANLDISKWTSGLEAGGQVAATSTNLGNTVVDLSLADKAVKTNQTTGIFVRDKYSSKTIGEKETVKATVTTAAAATANANYIHNAAAGEGTFAAANAAQQTAGYTMAYTAADTAQTINATSGWVVTAGAAAATITTTLNGAASGKDMLVANTGSDIINLKGAEDVVDETTLAGKDTISGYTSGKDVLQTGTLYDGNNGDYKFLLSDESNDVYLVAQATGDVASATNYAKLVGVGGNGKAVTVQAIDCINVDTRTYFFGNGKLTNGKLKADSFTYADGAYYLGNESGANTLKVGTDKTRASKTTVGDVVSIDLTDTNRYSGIDIVDASGSANAVALTAGAGHGTGNTVGYTLKGGSYKSTLTGGSGNDTLVGGSGVDNFVLGAIAGQDTISNYTSDKDILETTVNVGATNFKASSNDVVLTGTGTNQVTIEKAVSKAITVLANSTNNGGTLKTVYVGKSGAANKFTVSSAPTANDIYVGSTAEDTVALARTITKTELGTILENAYTDDGDNFGMTAVAKYNGGSFNITAANYSSVEVIDASGVKVAADAFTEYGSKTVKALSGVKVDASVATGTSFKGSAYDDKFLCDTAGTAADKFITNVNQGNDLVEGFNVGDVIQLNGLSKADIDTLSTTGITSGTAFKFSSGGSLKVTLDANAQNVSLYYDATNKQIKAQTN